MVAVVDGEAWEVNGTLYLDEQKSIVSSPTIAHAVIDSEVFDFAYSEKRDNTLKLKEVLFNPINEDILGVTSVTLDYNDDEFKGEVYFNPSLTAGYGYGINGLGQREPVRSVKTEKIEVDDDGFITTIGGFCTMRYYFCIVKEGKGEDS